MSATSKGNVASDHDLAQQWISFLQRRNTVLSIVWPVFLLLAISGMAAAMYFYHQHSVLVTQQQLKEQELGAKAQSIAALEEERDALQTRTQALATELSTLKENILSEQGLKSEQNKLNQELVATLKRKIAALEEDGRSLEALLVEKQQQVQSLTIENKKLNKSLVSDSREKNEAQKALKASQTAFEALSARQRETRQEVDRLASVLTQKEQQLNQSMQARQSLEKQLEERNAALALSQAKVDSLEKRLNSLLTPIEGTAVAPSNAEVNRLASSLASDAAKGAGDSEVELQAGDGVSFDYDSIAIERP
ncbi:MAG: hypothetical protein R3183_04130 [Oleiphilaceae bacterium]|nr:hypothetical protein [Oleiphilaceae bacterium]